MVRPATFRLHAARAMVAEPFLRIHVGMPHDWIGNR